MTSRTAWARRKTRTSLVSLSTVSHVGRAVSGKWSVSVRIGGLFYINYYENYENDIVGHEIVRIPSYRSNLFSTQTFQELLGTHPDTVGTLKRRFDAQGMLGLVP